VITKLLIISKKIPNFGNQTLPIFVNLRNSEFSAFRRALLKRLRNAGLNHNHTFVEVQTYERGPPVRACRQGLLSSPIGCLTLRCEIRHIF